jgi:hypothetical protein
MLNNSKKIISLTWRSSNGDIFKLSRWIRCLFQISFHHEEMISVKCVEQATNIAIELRDVRLRVLLNELLI